jgi:hypothetical protein
MALGALVTVVIAGLAFFDLISRAIAHARRIRNEALEPGAAVEILTPDRYVLRGTVLEREPRHFWVVLDPGDARMRVPAHWVSLAKRRARRRPEDAGSGNRAPRGASEPRADR